MVEGLRPAHQSRVPLDQVVRGPGLAAACGVAIAVARLVAQRAAAEAWKKATGAYPEGLEAVSP